MRLPEMTTEQNILKAFKGESRAKCAYLQFARQAESEGYGEIARLFRAAAASEDVHAHWLLRALRETSRGTNDAWEAEQCELVLKNGSTEENLRNAIGGEALEFLAMYPGMVRDAARDGWTFAHECFACLGIVELVHVGLFSKALDELECQRPAEYYVCEGCGNTLVKKPTEQCAVCAAPSYLFHAVR